MNVFEHVLLTSKYKTYNLEILIDLDRSDLLTVLVFIFLMLNCRDFSNDPSIRGVKSVSIFKNSAWLQEYKKTYGN
ncbi:MAG: hypothetical protein CMF45_05330 [Legionellales bacterium]|nr:hypothetical protein [Legionellales bacterium]|tara:strand:- start:753 stop:980 length:228 start_codon:yes stop_codon:yes gene_type:complete